MTSIPAPQYNTICLPPHINKMQRTTVSPGPAECLAPVSFQEMKRVLLVELEVSEEDINLMEASEIRAIYSEYQKEKAERIHSCSSPDNSLISKDDNTVQAQPLLHQKPSEGPRRVIINGEAYCRPKTLDTQAYRMSTNRITIISKPEPPTINEKRQKLQTIYSASMQKEIEKMDPQEIAEAYRGIKTIHYKEYFRTGNFLKNTARFVQKQIAVCPLVLEFEKDAEMLEFQPKIPETNAAVTANQNPNEPLDEFFDELIADSNIKEPSKITEPHYDAGKIISKSGQNWANQSSNHQLKDALQKSTPKESGSTLRQALNNKRIKQRKESSCQTEQTDLPTPRGRRPKTKITVVRQVQYIEDENHEDFEPRSRPDDASTLDIDLPTKINNSDLEKALSCPGEQPDVRVISWINNMKSLVQGLEKEYLSQFKSGWALVQ